MTRRHLCCGINPSMPRGPQIICTHLQVSNGCQCFRDSRITFDCSRVAFHDSKAEWLNSESTLCDSAWCYQERRWLRCHKKTGSNSLMSLIPVQRLEQWVRILSGNYPFIACLLIYLFIFKAGLKTVSHKKTQPWNNWQASQMEKEENIKISILTS